MRNKYFINLCYKSLLISLITSLTACASLTDKDNTPKPAKLPTLAKSAKPVNVLWHVRVGTAANNKYTTLQPNIAKNKIFTVGSAGQFTALNKLTGKHLWQQSTGLHITTGIASNDKLLFAGSSDGTLIALNQTNGEPVWQTKAPNEIIATPAANNTFVIVKSIDGHVNAYSAKNGKQLWSIFKEQPELVLYGASKPVISKNSIFVGFDDGTLSHYKLNNGELLWTQRIADSDGIFPVQRMVDIDSDPIVTDKLVIAATWQGRIASINRDSGSVNWKKPNSSYSPLGSSWHAIFLTNEKGHIKSLNIKNGKTLWDQKSLKYRHLTGPVINKNNLIVADSSGWIHWLNKNNGKIITRYRASYTSGIYTTPIVNNSIVYALTKDGQIIACQVS